MEKVIMGIQLDQRTKDAVTVQELLTKSGCYIKTRLGLNQNIISTTTDEESCGTKGLIIIEFFNGAEEEIEKLEQSLVKLDSVVVKKMVF